MNHYLPQGVASSAPELEKLAEIRKLVEAEVAQAGFVDTCAVIGMFNAINKVADMTGCRLDPTFFEPKAWSTGYGANVSSVALAIEALRLGDLRNGHGVRLTSAASVPRPRL